MTTVLSLPLVDVEAHPANPRTDLGDLSELADSIQSRGVLQPITVVPHPHQPTGYRCLLGHRRLAAAHRAGQQVIPAIIRTDLTDSEQVLEMGVENVHRADLSPVEEASWLQGILDLGQIKRSQLSKATGLSKTTVSTRLKLAHLPGPARDKVHTGQATLEDALALADADDLPDDVVEDLAGKLGTHAFSWNLQNAIRAAKNTKTRAELRSRLEALGVTWHDGPIDTTQYAHFARIDADTDLSTEDIPAGALAVPGMWGSGVSVYRPLTVEESEAAVAEEERRAALDAEREKRPSWQEQQEARRALVGPMNVARDLRVAFLTGFMTGARLLTPGQASAVTTELFVGAGAAGWEVDDLYGWLDHTRDVPLTLVQKYQLALASEGRDLLAVAALAAACEGPPDEEHDGEYSRLGWFTVFRAEEGWGWSGPIRRWYSLLEHLGYVPSEWEADQLETGLPDDPDGSVVEDPAEDEVVPA